MMDNLPGYALASMSNVQGDAQPEQLPTMVGERVSVKLLDTRHPVYVANEQATVDLGLLSEGGSLLRRNASRLLHQRPAEDADIYNARLNNFVYENILETAVGWYVAAMFGGKPGVVFTDRKGASLDPTTTEAVKWYTAFLQDCDNNHTTFLSFAKKLYTDILIHGQAFSLVDLPKSDPDFVPQTRAEQEEQGLLDPLVRKISPLSVINWECDKNGTYVWVVIKETYVEQTFLGKPVSVSRWYYYDRSEFYTFEFRKEAEVTQSVGSDNNQAVLLDRGRHCLASKRRVPLVRHALTDDMWLSNRVYLLLLAHLNQDNTLAWALFMSNLAIPVIIGDFDAAGMKVAENGFYQFPAGTTYGWTEPDGKSFVHSSNRLDSLREEIFRSMYLQAQGRAMHATPSMQSGRSKQLEMVPAHEVLQGMGNDLRRSLDLLLDAVVDTTESNVRMRVNGLEFQEDMTTEEVFAVTSVMSLKVPSETFQKYIYRKVARSWMRDATEHEKREVDEQINAAPSLEQRLLKEAEEMAKIEAKTMGGALSKIPSKPTQPPGRGGEGPSPNKKK